MPNARWLTDSHTTAPECDFFTRQLSKTHRFPTYLPTVPTGNSYIRRFAFLPLCSLYKYISLPRHHLRYCAHFISLPVADQGKVWPVGQVRPVGLSNPVHQTLVQDLVKTDVHPSVWHIITNWLIYIDSFGLFYLNYFKQHSIANQYCTTYCNSLSPALVSLLPSTAQYLAWCLWFRPSVNICPGWSNHM